MARAGSGTLAVRCLQRLGQHGTAQRACSRRSRPCRGPGHQPRVPAGWCACPFLSATVGCHSGIRGAAAVDPASAHLPAGPAPCPAAPQGRLAWPPTAPPPPRLQGRRRQARGLGFGEQRTQQRARTRAQLQSGRGAHERTRRMRRAAGPAMRARTGQGLRHLLGEWDYRSASPPDTCSKPQASSWGPPPTLGVLQGGLQRDQRLRGARRLAHTQLVGAHAVGGHPPGVGAVGRGLKLAADHAAGVGGARADEEQRQAKAWVARGAARLPPLQYRAGAGPRAETAALNEAMGLCAHGLHCRLRV